MNTVIIIPARFASVRFPGKPLVDIKGKTMIRRVYEKALQTGMPAYVATDHELIKQEVESFGGKVIMTSADHKNGTERCNEALNEIESQTGKNYDLVINIQGDEPFIAIENILAVGEILNSGVADIATLVKKINNPVLADDANTVKAVFDVNGRALYFSRAAIPFLRDRNDLSFVPEYFKHIGIYGYKVDVLRKIVYLPEMPLERAEKLEQNRWLESGYAIFIKETGFESPSIDTPDDLKNVLNNINLI